MVLQRNAFEEGVVYRYNPHHHHHHHPQRRME
jgi:hypothetical protein